MAKELRTESPEMSDPKEKKKFIKQFCLNRASGTGFAIDEKTIAEANKAYDQIERLTR